MKKETKKTSKTAKKTTEALLLDLLKRVLPKATHDVQLAGKIYQAVELELKATAKSMAFEKFCDKVELPDLAAKTIAEVKEQLVQSFGAAAEVTIKADKDSESVAVEVSLPDGGLFSGEIRVKPLSAEESDEQEITLKFAPFPVCMPGDKELVWLLAKRENMTPEEAGVALSKLEEDFWASKTGQKLLRDRVERSFPEFIARAPGGMLGEVGLKRHYKAPEPVKLLRSLSRR